MNCEEAIKVLDAAVYAKRKIHLKDVEVAILRGSWEGRNYYEIAEDSGYTPTYLKQDIGPKLWKLVSEALGERVSKTNFQAAVERRWREVLRNGEVQKDTTEEENSWQVNNKKDSSLLKEDTTGTKNNNFVGRQGAIAHLHNSIAQGAKIILIQGEGGIGKSLLSWEFLTTQGFDPILDLWMAKETQNITSAKSVAEEWLKRYFNEEPGIDFGVTRERLRQRLRDRDRRIGVLIDNLEPALNKDGRLIEEHRDYVELFRVLADPAGNCVTLITSRERLGESAVTFQDYRLEGLDLAAWEQFFESRNIKTNTPALAAIHKAYGGNAKAMHIISGTIQTDWEGDIDEYWRINQKNLLAERDLEDLVISQFNRLKELDPEAYKLLCRLGCFRYQDVRAVPTDGVLHLLWDVPESQRRRVIKSLRDRSLLDFLKGEHWLHPVIRAEARVRLKASDDWEIANRKAAEFWTLSVETVDRTEDALNALEAYYHYVDLEEYQLACEVVLKYRKTKLSYLGDVESLSNSFGRLGLVNHIISVITFITTKIKDEYSLTVLYGDLGGLYHRLGEIQNAIEFYQKAREMALNCKQTMADKYSSESQKFELERRLTGTLFTISSCKVALGENEEAIEAYKEAIAYTENTNFRVFAVFSWYALAYLYSLKDSEKYKQEGLAYLQKADKAYSEIPVNMRSTWSHIISYSAAGMVYINVGENEKALQMLEQAIKYAEESNSVQSKGQTLNQLAVVYRQQGELQKAIEMHIKALEILKQVAARSDIGDVYYELGLTYKSMGDIEKSRLNFAESIGIFEQINAPKKVGKAKAEMEA